MSAPILDLWLRTQYVVGGLMVTQNEGTAGGTVQCGDGTTAATFPTQLGLVNGVGHGVALNGSMYLQYLATLANATYTFQALVSRTTTGTGYLADARAGGGTGWLLDTGGTLTSSSGTLYVDAAASTALALGVLSLVTVAGITLNAASKLVIAADNALGNKWAGKMFNARLFSGTLSPAQIATETSRLKALLNV